MKKWLIIIVLPIFLVFGAIIKYNDTSLIDTYNSAYKDKFYRQRISTGYSSATSQTIYEAGNGSGFVIFSKKSNESGVFLSNNITVLDRIYYYPLTDLFFFFAQEFRLPSNFMFLGYISFVLLCFGYFIFRCINE